MTRNSPIEDLVPVILAGGSGTRLWPVSRALCPKHLVPLIGEVSLLQDTVKRVQHFSDASKLVVVGAANQGMSIGRQLTQLAGDLGDRLVLEPCARNTAAAVALSAHQAMRSFGDDAVIYVCPSDHLMLAVDKLQDAVEAGMKAARAGKLVTFGITPDRPETGYGYIKQGEKLPDAPAVLQVDKFVEKPELEVAKSMVSDGQHVWNSGMFLMRADRILSELAKFEPEIAEAVKIAFESRSEHGGAIPEALFSKVGSMPIDKAVMERSEHVAVVPCDPKWSDLGSWHAMWEIMEKDEGGNGTEGDVIVKESRNNIVKSQSRVVALAGVSDLAVIETPDAILVADRNRSEAVKAVVGVLADNARQEAEQHLRHAEKWGEIDHIRDCDHYSIFEVLIDPKAKVTAQEIGEFDSGLLIDGQGELADEGRTLTLERCQSFKISGQNWTISNPSSKPLQFIATKVHSA